MPANNHITCIDVADAVNRFCNCGIKSAKAHIHIAAAGNHQQKRQPVFMAFNQLEAEQAPDHCDTARQTQLEQSGTALSKATLQHRQISHVVRCFVRQHCQ